MRRNLPREDEDRGPEWARLFGNVVPVSRSWRSILARAGQGRQQLDTVERGRGRFRSFLLGAVKHFLADMRDRARAAKRGSGEAPLPIENETDTSPGLQIADAHAVAPECEFDRAWALALLDRALA